jgi:hypothetical protein
MLVGSSSLVLALSAVICVVVVSQYTGKTGFAATLYYSTSKCTTLTAGTFVPLGVCNYVGPKTSALYTSDPTANNRIYVTYYAAASNCTGLAATKNTSPLPGNGSCTRTQGSSSTAYGTYQQLLVYVTAVPSVMAVSGVPVFPYQLSTAYAGGCATLAAAVGTRYTYTPLFQNTNDTTYTCAATASCPAPTVAGGVTTAYSGAVVTCPMPPGSAATTGYALLTQYSKAPCTVANAAGFAVVQKLTTCDPQTSSPGSGGGVVWQSRLFNAFTSGTSTVVTVAQYAGSSCGAATLAAVQYYTAGGCPSNTTATGRYTFNAVTVAATLPSAPTGALAFYDYTTPAGTQSRRFLYVALLVCFISSLLLAQPVRPRTPRNWYA